MKKGQKKCVWTKEQKLEIIDKHLNEHISVRTLEKEYNADRSMICHWLRDYGKHGEAAFNYKGHPGNPFHYFNNERLSYKLNYKTPVQYRIEQGFE